MTYFAIAYALLLIAACGYALLVIATCGYGLALDLWREIRGKAG